MQVAKADKQQAESSEETWHDGGQTSKPNFMPFCVKCSTKPCFCTLASKPVVSLN